MGVDLDVQEAEPSAAVTAVHSRSGVVKYELEWKNIMAIANEENLMDLRQQAVRGDLRASPFRSVCWAVFLDVLKTPGSETWQQQRTAARHHYQRLKDQFVQNPHQQTTDTRDDPLSQSKQSLWNQHFCDQELCAVIKQDVVRTFPGVDFFRKPAIQELMTNILFCYARQFPAMCYRQGMHEILAPLIFVIHSDQQALAHIHELNPDIDRQLLEILNPEYLEEDSYAIFAKIMSQIESFYRINDMVPSATGYFPVQTSGSPSNATASPDAVGSSKRKPEVEVVEQLNYIKDKILIKEDLHLHNHLLKLDIPLAIFGIRWLRLLFGREFALQDLLLLWDAIFGEGNDLGLINYIVVAMLIRIRDKLIYSDYTTCLSYLMRYPTNIDIALVIRHALHMKSPKVYERPAGAMIFLSSPKHQPNQQQPPATRSKAVESGQLKYSTLPAIHQRRAQLAVDDHHPLQSRSSSVVTTYDDRQRTSSLPRDNGTLRKATAVELRQAACMATKKAIADSGQSDVRDPAVSDGYREDDPELLRIELQNTYNIMSVGRTKLLQYLSILRRNIRPTNPHGEVQQSLEGIEEICSLLKPRYDTVFRVPAPIDAATEANEEPQKAAKHAQSQQHPSQPRTIPGRMEQHSNAQRTQTPPNSLNLSRSYNYDLDCRRNSASQPFAQYEIPEDRYSRIATKKLANRKEVEMNVFSKDFSNPHRRFDDKDLPNANPLGHDECLE
ncbi:TBC1 domain family member 5 [Anopheles ziemanni]|uniref:TBC1 domain family member 5 n=2 Tax=coustani group TaxID=59130 RepID=UPI00265804C7|nr:TBC1 domain family member 5 isoform X1 [Anopheles coustani]XP_058171476.1 TBC1 domain family member 5 [Anopheles ziemanni]